MNRFIGVEIGGTKQQLVLGNERGEMEKTCTVKLGSNATAEDILAWIEKNVAAWMHTYEVKGMGVGYGGLVETATGRTLRSMHVKNWDNFPLQAWCEEKFGVPVCVINDTVAGGIGELYCGAGQGCDRLFYTNIGTGIGGGLYIDGRYYDGSGYGCSYLGHTWIPDWRKNSTDELTELELVCSGMYTERRLNEKGYTPKNSCLFQKIIKNEAITCKDLAQGAQQKDAFCMEELDLIAKSFSVGLANMLALVAPNKVVIGGGVAKMGEILFSRIRAFTDTFAFLPNKGRYEIIPSRFMDDAVLVGALLVAANQYAHHSLLYP